MRTIRLDYARPRGTTAPTTTSWPFLVVIATVAPFVVWLVLPNYGARTCGEAKTGAAGITVRTLEGACRNFWIDVGRYPTDAEGFDPLLAAPPDEPGWNGPYFKGDLVDPWGMRYVYRSTTGKPKIISPGPDGRIDTADDIHN